ncbi:hypothetical protein [Oceanobacillus sp. FSL W7-1281]|uniref:hypothetical protein n=1 Tax=Oceanobacillus sp. FSL W7-1281 TaxID=2921698 RepID=UPI0030D8B8B0
MATVRELQAKFSGGYQGFKSTVQGVKKEIESLPKTASSATKGMNDSFSGITKGISKQFQSLSSSAEKEFGNIGKFIDDTSKKLGDWGKDIRDAGGTVTKVMSPLTAFYGAAAVGGGKRMMDNEQLDILMGNTFRDEESYEAAWDSIRNLGDGTSFMYSDIGTRLSDLVASNIDLGKSEEISKSVLDYAVGSGQLGMEGDIHNILMSAIRSEGWDQNTLDMLAQRGLNLAGHIANVLGIETKAAQDMLKDGTISMEESLDYFVDAVQVGSEGAGGYFASMEDSAKKGGETMLGAWVNTKAAISSLGEEMWKSGAWDVLKNALNDITEFIYQLAPALEPTAKVIASIMATMVEWVQKLMNAFINLRPKTQALIAGLSVIGAVIGPAIIAFGTFVGLISSALKPLAFLFTGLSKAAGAAGKVVKVFGKNGVSGVMAAVGKRLPWLSKLFGILTGPIGLVISAFTLLMTTSETFRKAFGAMIMSIVDFGKQLYQMLKPAIDTVVDSFKMMLDSFKGTGNGLDSLGAAFAPLLDIIGFLVKLLIGGLAVAIAAVLPVISGMARALGPLLTALGNAISIVTNLGMAIISAFMGDMDKAVKYLKQAGQSFIAVFTNIWDALKGFLGGIGTSLMGLANGVIPGFSDKLSQAFSTIGTLGKYFFAIVEDGDYMNDWITHLPESIQGPILRAGEIFAGLRDKVIQAFDGIKQALTVDSFAGLLSNLSQSITGGFNAATDAIKQQAVNLSGAFVSTFGNNIAEKLTATKEIGDKIAQSLADGVREGIQRVSEAFGNVGGSITEAIGKGMNTKIGEMVSDYVQGTIDSFKSFGGAFGAILPSIVGFGSKLLGLTGPVGLVISIVMTLISTLVKLYKSNEDVRNFIQDAWQGIQDVFSGVLSALQPIFDELGKAFGDIGKELGPEFVKTKGVIVDSINELKPTFQELGETFGELGQTFGELFREMGVVFGDFAIEISNVFKGIIPMIAEFIGMLVDTLKEIIPVVIEVVTSFISIWVELQRTLITSVLEIAKQVIPMLLEAVQAVLPMILGIIQSVLPMVVDLFSMLADAVMNIVKTVLPMLISVVQSVLPMVLNIVKSVLPMVISIFTMLIDVVMNLVKSVLPMILNVVNTVFPMILNVIQNVLPIVIEILSTVISVIMELAQTVIPIILDVVQAAFPIIQKIIEVAMKIAVTALGLLVRVIQNVVVPAIHFILEVVQIVFPVITNVIDGALNIIIGILNFFISLFTGDWSGMWESIKQILSGAVKIVWSVIKGVFDLVALFIKNIFSGIASFFGTIWSTITNIFKTVITAIYNFVKERFTAVKNTVTTLFSAVWDFISNIWNTIYSFFKNILTSIYNFIKNRFTAVWNTISTIFNTVKDFITTVWNAIYSFFKEVIMSIVNFIRDRFSSMRDNVSSIFNKIKDIAKSAWNKVKDNIVDPIKSGVKWALDKFTEFKNKVSDTFSNIKDSVFDYVSDMIQKIKDMPGEMKEKIEAGASKVKDGFLVIASRMVDGIASAVNGVGKAVNWVADKLGMDSIVGTWKPQDNLDWYSYAHGTKSHPGGPALINDGTGNNAGEELIINPDGTTGMYQGKNVLANLAKGTQVIPAKKTRELLSNIPAYAKGIFGSAWDGVKAVGSWTWDKTKQGAGYVKDTAVGAGKAIGEWTGNVWDYVSNPGKLVDIALEKVGAIIPDGAGAVVDLAKGAFKTIKDKAIEWAKEQLNMGGPDGVSGGMGLVGAAGNWRSQIQRAAAQMGESVTPAEINGILAQINRESGGNQRIVQSSAVWDVNTAAGNPARGLLQYIPQTFNAYKVRGHGNIYSGYDQLLAFFNNRSWRRDLPYGRRGWGPRGGRKYKQGTNYVPEDGPAYLHKGEAVVPAKYNQPMDSQNLITLTGSDGIVSELSLIQELLKVQIRETINQNPFLNRIVDGIRQARETLSNQITEAKQSINDGMNTKKDELSQQVVQSEKSMIQTVGQKSGEMISSVGKSINTMGQRIEKATGQAISKLETKIESVEKKVVKAQSAADKAQKTASKSQQSSSKSNGIKGRVNNLIKKGGSAARKYFDAIKEDGDWMNDWSTNIGNGSKKTMKPYLLAGYDYAKSLGHKLGSSAQKHLSRIRKYADGGVARFKQLAWVADGGWAESIISHDPAKRLSQRGIWEQTGRELGFIDKSDDKTSKEVISLLMRIADAVETGQNLDVIMNDKVVGRMLEPIITERQKRKNNPKKGGRR